ncbi:MAG: RNA methyltransferase [Cyclobacteriaceae bacterium]|nr:RNA methyltransferase [Cyclobacteriaceae bacterium]
MITNAQLKEIKSLQLKKNRTQQQRFLVEGAKSVLELVDSDFKIEHLLCTKEFFDKNYFNESNLGDKIHVVSEKQLVSIGTFKSNSLALAVAKIKPNIELQVGSNELSLVLDDVRDPGNLGTIIRIADWYGIKNIIVSETTADMYNPKVINATMGSFGRVNIFYTHLPSYLENYNGNVFGTFMEGKNIHTNRIKGEGLVIMGNESNGISEEVEKFVTEKITIPKFGVAESLNVAVATAIVCDNLRK